jgi:acetylornithine deacetylase
VHPLHALLADLIRIPSVNPMGRAQSGDDFVEEHLAGYVAEYLRRSGVEVELDEVTPRRPNVIARITTGARETILLEAHLDTVRVDGMTIPPFEPVVRDGRLFGRGACDTKASLAAFLYAVTSVLAEGRRPRHNVVLLAVADEEYQFTGARRAVERGLGADWGIVGEPTSLGIIHAHKGVTRWRIHTTGRAAHSAYPQQGENAIYTMAQIVARLDDYALGLQEQVPHPLLGPPTLSVGVIEGGQAVNVVPDHCWIEIDRRTLPGENAEEVMADVRHVLREVNGWTMEAPHLSVAGMHVPDSSAAVTELSAALRAVTGNAVLTSAPYATDAGLYCQAGVPCVVFGPGDIAEAHTSAESVPLKEVEQCADVIRRVLT